MQESINPTQGETSSPAPVSGSALLTGAALLGGAALLAATPKEARAVTPPLQFSAIPGTGDQKILNYALALEALEANLYVQVRQRLAAQNVPSSDSLVKYVEEFGTVEAQHRDYLDRALGSVSILRTVLRGATFDFQNNLSDRSTILNFLITVETTGVQAYIGGVPYFRVQSPFLPTAAAILGTEARHTAALIAIKNLSEGTTLPTAPLYNQNDENGKMGRDVPKTPQQVLNIVSPFINLATT